MLDQWSNGPQTSAFTPRPHSLICQTRPLLYYVCVLDSVPGAMGVVGETLPDRAPCSGVYQL